MPTENERKWVLDPKCASIDHLSGRVYEIAQGYLIATRGITVRVRKLVLLNDKRVINKCDKKVEYYFTLKVNVGSRVVEVEDKLCERDFKDLWNISVNKLQKTRYEIWCGDLMWEIDFFKDYRGETYFVVAECEMPEGVQTPEHIPDFVRRNLLFEVPLTDIRFSNKLLADPRYALQLLEELNHV